jgi:hypothetical protein
MSSAIAGKRVEVSPSSPKSSSFLRQFHFLDGAEVYFPIVYVEMGAFETRLGVWNPESERFELRYRMNMRS